MFFGGGGGVKECIFYFFVFISSFFLNERKPQYSFELNQHVEDDLKKIVKLKIIKIKTKNNLRFAKLGKSWG